MQRTSSPLATARSAFRGYARRPSAHSRLPEVNRMTSSSEGRTDSSERFDDLTTRRVERGARRPPRSAWSAGSAALRRPAFVSSTIPGTLDSSSREIVPPAIPGDRDEVRDRGLSQLRDELRRSQEGRQRDQHGADAKRGVGDDRPVDSVRREQRDSSVFADAGRDQPARELPGCAGRARHRRSTSRRGRVRSSRRSGGAVDEEGRNRRRFNFHRRASPARAGRTCRST